MTKQVGTKPYQTPRNADLGTMAYQDADNASLKSPSIVGEDNDTALSIKKPNGEVVAKLDISSGDNFSISATSGGGAGLLFWGGGGTDPLITPMKENDASGTGEVAFGRGGQRFKELWLTEGVILSADSTRFDSYEEGDWTPTVTIVGSNPTDVGSASARYTRVGRLVTLHGAINGITGPIGRGRVVIANLPFAQWTASTLDMGICDNYPHGEAHGNAGIVINNSSGNTNQWYIEWYNDSAQSSDQVRFFIQYTTS